MSSRTVQLKAKTPLNSIEKKGDGVTVTEITGMALVCAAIPKDGESKAKEILQKHYKISLPEMNQFFSAADGKLHFLRIAQDQLFFFFEYQGHDSFSYFPSEVRDNFYLTEQTDAFAILLASGDKLLDKLSFICMLDLDRFAVGSVTRTLMEHQGHYIMRKSLQDFIFLTPSSSCESFALFHYV